MNSEDGKKQSDISRNRFSRLNWRHWRKLSGNRAARIGVATLGFLILVGASWFTRGGSARHGHVVWHSWSSGPATFGDTFEWQERSAVEFLKVLQGTRRGAYTVVGLHHDWVTDADVEQLVAQLHSKTPCAFVVSAASSTWPRGASTVGHEAAFLLEGYRNRFYPPELSSSKFEPDLDELKFWHQRWATRDLK